MKTTPKFVYVTLISTTPEKLWEALTDPQFTVQYWGGTSVESDWKVGSPVIFRWRGEIVHNEAHQIELDEKMLEGGRRG